MSVRRVSEILQDTAKRLQIFLISSVCLMHPFSTTLTFGDKNYNHVIVLKGCQYMFSHLDMVHEWTESNKLAAKARPSHRHMVQYLTTPITSQTPQSINDDTQRTDRWGTCLWPLSKDVMTAPRDVKLRRPLSRLREQLPRSTSCRRLRPPTT